MKSLTASKRFGNTLGAAIAIVLLMRSLAMPALAALGEDVSSVETDRVKMKAQAAGSSTTAGYAVHEITTPTGTVVREYISGGGKVFAVSWHGPVLPDLRQTLGTYFTEYQTAASTPHGGHNHLTVRHPGLIVHSGGHMRAYYGLAYVPSLLPQNFPVDQIK